MLKSPASGTLYRLRSIKLLMLKSPASDSAYIKYLDYLQSDLKKFIPGLVETLHLVPEEGELIRQLAHLGLPDIWEHTTSTAYGSLHWSIWPATQPVPAPKSEMKVYCTSNKLSFIQTLTLKLILWTSIFYFVE
jgi:hypothetical protein